MKTNRIFTTRQKVSMIVYRKIGQKFEFLVAQRPNSKIWQYPTANCEKGEKYRDCAFREIKEELGDVNILNFTDLNKSFSFESSSGKYKEHIVSFEIAKIDKLQEAEFSRCKFLPVAEAQKCVFYEQHKKYLEVVYDLVKSDKVTKFFIFVAPTASGKSVIIKNLLDSNPEVFERVRTYMTRKFKRAEDSLLRVYATKIEFLKLYKAGKLIERNYHDGNWYGSSFKLVEEGYKSGKHILAEVDINGLRSLKTHFSNIISFFILAPLDEIEFRVKERGGHNEQEIAKRLKIAKEEISQKDFCDNIVRNPQGKLDQTIIKIKDIISAKTGKKLI